MEGLRIVIAENDINKLQNLTDLLTKEGHTVIAKAEDSTKLLKIVTTVQPEVILISTSLPGENLFDLLFKLNYLHVAPVILVSEELDLDLLEDSIKSGCQGYLVYPLYSENIIPVIEYAVNNFRLICSVEEENRELKQKIEQRKLIEKAKGLLIDKKEVTEKQAYDLLRKISMDKCVPMYKVAASIIKKLQ